MRDEFLETPVSRHLLEAAEKTVSCSCLCLGFVVSQSVMPVEQFVYVEGQNALLCGEDVWLCMCGFDNNNLPALLALLK